VSATLSMLHRLLVFGKRLGTANWGVVYLLEGKVYLVDVENLALLGDHARWQQMRDVYGFTPE
jgi:hypothetical protein